jgi:hypothetical protein
MALSITHSTVVAVADDGTSPVGSDEWNDAHAIAGTVGPDVGARELLTADRTYYVRTDGSDSNTGLANTAGGAFLTIQKAMDVIASTLDLGGKTVTVQVGNGTYAGGLLGKVCVGQAGTSSILFLGDATTPSNVVIDRASGVCFNANTPGVSFTVQGFELNSGDDSGLNADNQGVIDFQDVIFGACVFAHMTMFNGGSIFQRGEYEINGNSDFHFLQDAGGHFTGTFGSATTVTVTGTPAFSVFAYAGGTSTIYVLNVTYSGGATGTRYLAEMNGIIQTFGGGANYFPGDVAGSTATGGQYA